MRRKSWVGGGLAILAGLGVWGVAEAWWVKGHATITEAAADALPDDVPAFFRAAGKTLAHCAGDPDRWKNREAKFLKSAVYPEHFIDWEDLEGNEPPADRYVFLALAQKIQKAPDKVGTLPWAIMEGDERGSCDRQGGEGGAFVRGGCGGGAQFGMDLWCWAGWRRARGRGSY